MLHARELVLELREQGADSINLGLVYFYIILIVLLDRPSRRNRIMKLVMKYIPSYVQTKFRQSDDNVLIELYASAVITFFIIDERRKGNLPAWEGIRLLRTQDI